MDAAIFVGDLAESLRRVKAEGGEVIKEHTDDGKCVHAVIKDPIGVYVTLEQGCLCYAIHLHFQTMVNDVS